MTGAAGTARAAGVAVERLGPGDWEAVRPLLRRHDPRMPEDRWRMLFHRPWDDGDDHRGFGLVSDGHVVGFCGVVRSRRVIDGEPRRIANLTTWVVEDPFRAHALRVMTPLLRMADHTLTDLTPSPEVARWTARWGFTPVETAVAVLACPTPLPVPVGRRPWITADPGEVLDVIRGEDRRIVADHLAVPGCGAVAAGDGRSRCVLVYTTTTLGTPHPYAYLLHVGDSGFLRRHHAGLRAAVARAAGVRFVVTDARTLPGRLPALAWRMPLEVPRAVRAAGCDPHRIDALYSEVALLGLGSIPGPLPDRGELPARLRAALRRGVRT